MATSPKFESYLLPISIVLASIILAVSICYSSKNGVKYAPTQVAQQAAAPSAGTAQAKPAVDVKLVKTDGEPYVGKINAPVTVAYWFDYQCPFCKQYEQNVVSKLMTEYVASGKVRIVFKDFAFLGADSTRISLASNAVWSVSPSKWYAWHKNMFDNQGRENSGWATVDKIRELTLPILGAGDTDKVIGLMTSKATEFQAKITADKQEGGTFGVTGTPSVVIGKQLIVGARQYEDIKAAVDAVK